mmetsp:Transcript_107942/g.302344  ORF Transcript_107942/g.302344 Transcript_107942/m.302344 type:complete len:731 (-) Transcript_107942:234-2426(-)
MHKEIPCLLFAQLEVGRGRRGYASAASRPRRRWKERAPMTAELRARGQEGRPFEMPALYSTLAPPQPDGSALRACLAKISSLRRFEGCASLPARPHQLDAQAREKHVLRVLLSPVGHELGLCLVAEQTTRELVRERLNSAIFCSTEAPKLAHMGLGPQLVHEVVFHLLEGPLPGLVVFCQVLEGEHLHSDPPAGLHRLQDSHVPNVDEAELPRQVPDEFLAPEALELHLLQLVHRREDILWGHEVRRGDGGGRLRLPEAVVDLVALALHKPRDVPHHRHGELLRQAQRAQAPQQVVHVDARHLDGRGPLPAGRLAPRHAPVPVVLDALRQELVVAAVHARGDAELALEGDVDAAVGLLHVPHHRRQVLVVEEVEEKLPAEGLPRAVAPHLPDLGGEVGLRVALDEAPELLLAPRRHLLRYGVHLELDPVLELELDAQNDAEQAVGAPPVAELLLLVDDADAPVVAHDSQPGDVAVDEASVVGAPVHAVGDDAPDLEEVSHGLRRHEEAQRADLGEEVRLSPAGVDRRALAAVRHWPNPELPLAGSRVLGEGDHEHVLVPPIGDEAAGRVSRAADPHPVALLGGVGQGVLEVLVRLRHDPRRARVEMVRPTPEGAPREGIECPRMLKLRVAKGCPKQILGVTSPATARVAKGPVAELVTEPAVVLVMTHAHLVVPLPAIWLPIAIAIVVRDYHRRISHHLFWLIFVGLVSDHLRLVIKPGIGSSPRALNHD